jgi:hypothetical protein
MRIHAATIGLTERQIDILERVYEDWQPPHVAYEQMGISDCTFYRARKSALEYIEKKLCRPVDGVTDFHDTDREGQ